MTARQDCALALSVQVTCVQSATAHRYNKFRRAIRKLFPGSGISFRVVGCANLR